MKVWLDENGGRHYHQQGCPLIDKRYIEIEAEVIKHSEIDWEDIEYKEIIYRACPFCCYPTRRQ